MGQVVERRYRVEALIGRGAMGAVYRARHVKVGREVAIKVLHEHLVCDAAMVARFDREAALLARLRHRNLVNVIDVGEAAAHRRLMVLELARGESLASILASGPLGRDRVIDLVKQLLLGLEHAHAAGLVHRDLKPENVIVERDRDGAETPRIVDFGIAVLCDPGGPGAGPDAARRITELGMVLGTPAYMAPEQAYGADPDPRTDLFALGVMVYEMLAGVQPFGGCGVDVILANVSRDPPPIRNRAPGVPVDPLLEDFARRLMARDLADRFPSARAALEALALIERDREAASEAFGLVTEMDLADTAPSIPIPVLAPAVVRGTPPPEPAPAAVAAPGAGEDLLGAPAPRRRPRGGTLLGCAVFLAGAALAFALVAA